LVKNIFLKNENAHQSSFLPNNIHLYLEDAIYALIAIHFFGVVYSKNDGLTDFTRSIACARLFIAGSTGPLHIAATIDIPTVGFFPSKRSSTPLRWLPINSEGRHLAFCPPKGGGEELEADMSRINVDTALETLNPWVARYLS